MLKNLFLLGCSFSVFASPPENINNYENYQLIKGPAKYAAVGRMYQLKSDPCIYLEMFKANKTKRFCQLGDSGMDLEKDYPSVYAARLTVSLGGIAFIAAAPWSEQQCNIDIDKFEIYCKPTGR